MNEQNPIDQVSLQLLQFNLGSLPTTATNLFNLLYFSNLVLVVLQVRLVLPGVTQNDDENGKVDQWLTRCIVSVKVGGLVLAPWGDWLLCSWSRTSWQLLVERDNLGHSLGVRVGSKVLEVSIQMKVRGNRCRDKERMHKMNS